MTKRHTIIPDTLSMGRGCVWNRRLVGGAENPGTGAMKGRGVQCGLVWLNCLTATALAIVLVRPSHQIRVLSPSSAQEEAVKQRMMGSTCSAASRMEWLSQSPWPGLEVPIANSDYRCRSAVGGVCGCGWVYVRMCVCPSAVLPVCPARGRICMNQSQKLIDEFFFCLACCCSTSGP